MRGAGYLLTCTVLAGSGFGWLVVGWWYGYSSGTAIASGRALYRYMYGRKQFAGSESLFPPKRHFLVARVRARLAGEGPFQLVSKQRQGRKGKLSPLIWKKKKRKNSQQLDSIYFFLFGTLGLRGSRKEIEEEI